MHSGNYLYKKTTLGVGREWGYCKEVFVQLFCSLPWMAISNRTQWGISQAGFIAACQGIKSADAKQTCWCYAYLHWASWGWLSTQVLQHRKQVRTDVFPLSKSYFQAFSFNLCRLKGFLERIWVLHTATSLLCTLPFLLPLEYLWELWF